MSGEPAPGSPLLALEINDVGLVALRAGAARPEPASPGVALLDGSRLLVGAEAAARAWSRPRFADDTFWDRLDDQPIGRPFPAQWTRADLAHAHLESVREGLGGRAPETVLAVPGTWGTGALGLLLSVARAAGFPVVGLVDAAVAAGALGHRGEVLLHLDVTRHRAVVTELSQGNEVVRTRVAAADSLGWRVLEEAWADAVAAQFVRETRFDPLHAGASEQALHEALPGWLDELGIRESMPAALAAAGREHRIELTRAALLAAVAVPLHGLVELVARFRREGQEATLLLSARAGRVPGLAERLRGELGVDVDELTLPAAASGVLACRDQLRHGGEALPFVTRLPSGVAAARRQRAASASVAAVPGDGRPPTHVVNGGVAHAVGSGELAIGTAPPAGVRSLVLLDETGEVAAHHCSLLAAGEAVVVEDRSGGGTFVNGARVEGRTALRAGDRLQLGRSGRELALIALSGAEDEG